MGGLVRTRNVPTSEAVSIFLHILAHNLKYRVVQFSYCRSKETISRQFNDVLRVVMKVSKDYLIFQSYTLEGVGANKWKWFKKCIRALDGTHILITVSPYERPRYRNRKGDVSTNVLVACGGKGLQEILEYYEMHCIIKTNLKFQLVGTFLWMQDILMIGNTPQSYKELFNICHASAQNAIESVVDEEFVHQSREGVQNNVTDDIITIQAIEDWTKFQDSYEYANFVYFVTIVK
ncbi:hypothetical protein GmHk_09G025243 [Glycine max]|nr:hypothetical protein GmHk_09G025243 [Glycine max]